MRRFYFSDPKLLLLLGVTVFGAFAWLTRHPDTDLLRRAEHWPIVGSLASGFRASYAPPRAGESTVSGNKAEGKVGRDLVEVETVHHDRVSAQPQVWVEAGTEVQASPRSGSELLATVEALGNYSVIERRGDWFHIYRYSANRQVLDGWILLVAYEEPSADRLQRPDPVLPLAAALPDPEKVRRARSFMAGGGIETRCGSYVLYTDLEGDSTAARCGQLADHLDDTYQARFGLVPVGEPAEAILLFRSAEAYQGFVADDESIPAEKGGHARPARGYVALYTENLPSQAVESTLVHELTHLINRRALGPALPPWLSEGLADDLAESPIDASGRLILGELGGYSLAMDGRIHHFGGPVSARLLSEALEGEGIPDLHELVQMGWDEFHVAPQETLLYALSSFWVRFLLSGEPGSEPDGFRTFLKAVSSGQRMTPELLVQHLGGDWRRLEAGFRTWLRVQAGPMPEIAAVEIH